MSEIRCGSGETEPPVLYQYCHLNVVKTVETP